MAASGEAGCSAGRFQERNGGARGSWGAVVGRALAAWVYCCILQPFAVGRAEPLVLSGPGRGGGGGRLAVCRCEDTFVGSAGEQHLAFTLNGPLNPLCL